MLPGVIDHRIPSILEVHHASSEGKSISNIRREHESERSHAADTEDGEDNDHNDNRA